MTEKKHLHNTRLDSGSRGFGGAAAFEAPPAASMENDIYEIQYYWDLARVNTIGELNEKILNIVNKLGFSDFTFCRLGGPPTLEHKMLTTLDEVIALYEQEAFYECDIMLKHIESRTTPLYMSVVEKYMSKLPFEPDIFRRNHDMIRLCNYYGFNDFYGIPMISYDGEGKVSLGVSTKGLFEDDFIKLVEKNKEELRLLVKAIDYVGTRKFPEFFIGTKESPQVVISPRPLQLLTVMAQQNLQLKQAADVLCIGIDTANKHMAAVKQALGANTPASAVYRAIKEGLIDCH